MSITQETADIINSLANSASQIGSTPASAKINQLIVELLPVTTGDSAESIADALLQDNAALQEDLKSLQINVENLNIVRGKMKKISLLATEMLGEVNGSDSEAEEIKAGLRTIIDLSEDVGA